MTTRHLHIVCLDVPYPADYGGVFDLFYKIQSLKNAGINIHLHCFEYGRGKQEELDKYCYSVNYYERKNFLSGFSFRTPFIVRSRANSSLLKNLNQDDFPVLLEGIHCTYFLSTGELKNRKLLVRLHNVEFEYYEELSYTTGNFLKKTYFNLESAFLKKYENKIANSAMLIAVSEKDRDTYQRIFGANNIEYLAVFLPFNEIKSEPGNGSFCLYHGNLSVPENEKAALWLLKNVFNTLNIPFVIAGKNPSKHLAVKARHNKNVCLVANPSDKAMDDLILKAQIHVLPSFNKTGIKIKLLNALYNGRHVITSRIAIEKTPLESICKIAGEPETFRNIISELFYRSFTEGEIEVRKKILKGSFNNEANAQQLIKWIW